MESSSARVSASPSMDLKEEVKCPICMEYLTDPVTLDCGHNFCRGCISQYCEKWEGLGNLECPLCKAKMKKGSFRPNWQLANVVGKIKCLSLNLGKERLCVRHKEKPNLFCKEDQELVCVICERSPEHRSHTVLLLQEAAEECMDVLCCYLLDLKKERVKILESKEETEKESQDLLGQIEEKKTRTVTVFNQLQQFLEEQKTSLILQLEEMKKEIATRTEEHMAILMEELTSLEGLIKQMEEKCQQPANELLQDIRRTLQSYERKKAFENPVAFPPELLCRIEGFHVLRPILKGVMAQFPAMVTLDPDTAHPKLILSEDRRSVRWAGQYQDLRDNPERFDCGPCVLGTEGFTAGRHFWEVTVGGEGDWAVGVARKSVGRKGFIDLSPGGGIWAVGKWRDKYRAPSSPSYSVLQALGFTPFQKLFDPPRYTPLSQSQELKRIRVTLDCAEMQVAFSDADSGVHIYTYSAVSFGGETLLPFFWVFDGAHLRLSH